MTTMPITEHLEDYTYESAYLNQEANSARYYIAGKGVCVTESGSLLWYDMPQEDSAFFLFDQVVLNEHLSSDFTQQEQQALSLIRKLDEQAQELGLHVVTTRDDGGNRQYAVFFSPQSQSYFAVLLEEIERVNLITANIMAQHSEPNCLAEPQIVQLREDGAIY